MPIISSSFVSLSPYTGKIFAINRRAALSSRVIYGGLANIVITGRSTRGRAELRRNWPSTGAYRLAHVRVSNVPRYITHGLSNLETERNIFFSFRAPSLGYNPFLTRVFRAARKTRPIDYDAPLYSDAGARGANLRHPRKSIDVFSRSTAAVWAVRLAASQPPSEIHFIRRA